MADNNANDVETKSLKWWYQVHKWTSAFGLMCSFAGVVASLGFIILWSMVKYKSSGVTTGMRFIAAADLLILTYQMGYILVFMRYVRRGFEHKTQKFNSDWHLWLYSTVVEGVLAVVFEVTVFPLQLVDPVKLAHENLDDWVENLYFNLVPSLVSKMFLYRIMAQYITLSLLGSLRTTRRQLDKLSKKNP